MMMEKGESVSFEQARDDLIQEYPQSF